MPGARLAGWHRQIKRTRSDITKRRRPGKMSTSCCCMRSRYHAITGIHTWSVWSERNVTTVTLRTAHATDLSPQSARYRQSNKQTMNVNQNACNNRKNPVSHLCCVPEKARTRRITNASGIFMPHAQIHRKRSTAHISHLGQQQSIHDISASGLILI